MNTIIQRKDKTSICCPKLNQHHTVSTEKTKAIGFTIGCSLIVVGLFIIFITI